MPHSIPRIDSRRRSPSESKAAPLGESLVALSYGIQPEARWGTRQVGSSAPCRRKQLGDDWVFKIEIGRDSLDVVVVLERLE